jgi:hypothetical protein
MDGSGRKVNKHRELGKKDERRKGKKSTRIVRMCGVYGDGGQVVSKGLRKMKNLKKCDYGWVQDHQCK